MNANFINVNIDAEKGEGPDLVRRFEVFRNRLKFSR